MPIDGQHPTVMSCQFARPMGRFAGHNVVAGLAGRPLLALSIDSYGTVLDLGRWAALYTSGGDRAVLSSGAAATGIQHTIHHERIVPPGAAALLSAAPVVQPPPAEVAAVIVSAPVMAASVQPFLAHP